VAYTRCRRLIGGILVFFARWKTPQVSLRLREVSGLPGLVHPRARFCIFVNGLVKPDWIVLGIYRAVRR
jgi:hypothetical protein